MRARRGARRGWSERGGGGWLPTHVAHLALAVVTVLGRLAPSAAKLILARVFDAGRGEGVPRDPCMPAALTRVTLEHLALLDSRAMWLARTVQWGSRWHMPTRAGTRVWRWTREGVLLRQEQIIERSLGLLSHCRVVQQLFLMGRVRVRSCYERVVEWEGRGGRGG